MLLNDDCLVAMQKLVDDGVQVDSIVTDPPYHLQSIVDRFGKKGSAPAKHGTDGAFARASKGFMGQEWDGGDIAFRQETWELALKLLKPGGHLLAFSASRNYHRMAVAIEDAGFEIRDQLMWLYGSGFPKSHNLGDGWGTALKPAHEPIVMARKFIEGTNKNNREKYGTAGINIDGCRVELSEGDDPRLGGKGTWKTDKAGKEIYGLNFGEDIASSELGRFPANVMHDGSEEVVSGFPNTKSTKRNPRTITRTKENLVRLNNSEEVFVNCEYDDEGSAARFFYCPKVSKSERNIGLYDKPEKQYSHDGRKKKIENPYQGNESVSKNTHPTVKPIELMKYLCRLVTPKGGTVLDPFMGSGSTGMACKYEGFEFIGIEQEKEYFEIAEKRIKSSLPLMEFM
jgi:site-specific DNA-methyltransferase (adenine-specific)